MSRRITTLKQFGNRRRNAELLSIVFSVVVIIYLYVLASIGRLASIPANIGPIFGFVLALLVTAHIATRLVAKYADPTLLPIVIALNGIGYVFVARINPDLAANQAIWTLIGITAYCLTLFFIRRVRVLEDYSYIFLFAGLFLLLMPLLPGIGQTLNGSRIWVKIGPISFQPGEFAKIALAVFFASYLGNRRQLLSLTTFKFGPINLPPLRFFAPVLMAWGVAILVMVYERDLGSSLLFFVLFLCILWVATEKISYVIVGLGLFGLAGLVAYRSFSHVALRVDTWLNPWADPRGDAFHITEASFAMAEGGLTGTGPGLGDPGRIPIAESDFIFAAIGEELGLVGDTIILIAFMLLVGSGLRIAARAEDAFDKLLAVGLSTLLGIQAFIIIGGVVRLVPLTGVTLPFVSYGGSSLLANYVIIALLMRTSHEVALQRVDGDSSPRRNREISTMRPSTTNPRNVVGAR